MNENIFDETIYQPPYVTSDGCLYERVSTKNGVETVKLADFIPILKAEITRDDGITPAWDSIVSDFRPHNIWEDFSKTGKFNYIAKLHSLHFECDTIRHLIFKIVMTRQAVCAIIKLGGESMDFDIPNNKDYDMPEDTFFKFHFLAHRSRLYTAKKNFQFGELTVELLNTPVEVFRDLYVKTVEFAAFCHTLAVKNDEIMAEFANRIIDLQSAAIKVPPYCFTNIDLEKEKQLAAKMGDSQLYSKLYDTLSDEYEIYDKFL